MSSRSPLPVAAVIICVVTLAWVRMQAPRDVEREVAAPLLEAAVGVATDGSAVPAAAPQQTERGALFQLMEARTPAEVREVLRLTKEATAANHSALREAALHAQDALVAGNAIKALGRLRLFSADPDLLALIADPRPRVRQDAVAACSLDGRSAAIPGLEKALTTGDAALRPLVLEALGRIGGSAARGLLERVAGDSGSSVTDRVFAHAALARVRD